MRKIRTVHAGILSLFLILLAVSAAAKDATKLSDIPLRRIGAPAPEQSPTESLHASSVLFPSLDRPPRQPMAPRLRIEEKDDLAALNFSSSGFISPYVGAGLSHEDPPIHDPAQPQTLTLRLGAGFDCNLDALTRIFFNYSFRLLPDPTSESKLRPDENHNISLGLRFAF